VKEENILTLTLKLTLAFAPGVVRQRRTARFGMRILLRKARSPEKQREGESECDFSALFWGSYRFHHS
jgi:hypothetical protein